MGFFSKLILYGYLVLFEFNLLHGMSFSHIGIWVKDVSTSAKWYGQFFEAEITFQSDDIAFLSWDDESHRIALLKWTESRELVGMNHIAFKLNDITSLVSKYKTLKKAGFAPFQSFNHGMTTSLYYRDFDGNGIELMIDNFSSEASFKVSAYYASFMEYFITHPEGLAINFNEIVKLEKPLLHTLFDPLYMGRHCISEITM